MKQRGLVIWFVIGLCLSSSGLIFAQGASPQPAAASGSIDQDITMLRKDLRSQRKQLIAANMNLTGDEAEKFWPVYEQYVSELVQINNAKYDLIKQYAQNAGTVGWPARKRVHVQEIVARVQTKPACRFFLGAKGRPIQAPAVHVPRQ